MRQPDEAELKTLARIQLQIDHETAKRLEDAARSDGRKISPTAALLLIRGLNAWTRDGRMFDAPEVKQGKR